MSSTKINIIAFLTTAALISFSGFAHAYHHKGSCKKGYHHCAPKLTEPCCTTAKMRFAKCNESYKAGCRAAQTYVEGDIGSHSKAWNEGFSDCRFNVYRSDRTEREAEKTICGYTHCYR